MSTEGRLTYVDKHVGARIRMARNLASMSQEKLGDALGVSFQQIQKYEKGINSLSPSRLVAVATALGRPVVYFFEGLAQARVDQPMPDPLATLGETEQGVRLARAFVAIRHPEQRQSLVKIAESIAPSH